MGIHGNAASLVASVHTYPHITLDTIKFNEQHKKMNLAVEVRTVVNQAKKEITTCKTAQELADILIQFLHLLKKNSSDSSQKQPGQNFASSLGICYSAEFSKEFISRHYSHICEYLLISVEPSFLEDGKFRGILTSLFTDGPAELSFLALVSSIAVITHTNKLHLVVDILSKFASCNKFNELFLSQCLENSTALTDELLTMVTSLPDKLANKLKLALNGKFHPNVYYKILGKEIITTLMKVHEVACQSGNYSTEFLSNLIGKVAMRGCTTILFDVLLPQLKEWCYISPLWSNICSNLITQVSEYALEPIIECLLKKITFYPFFCKILKDYGVSNAVMKHLITHKFLFVRFYDEPNVLTNILGYLCGEGRRPVLVDVLETMLSHWGNSNTIKHSSYEQHFYVTKAIILATVQLDASEVAANKNALLHKMLYGVQAHLESTNVKIRELGMVVAECMTALLQPDSEKLKFDIVEDDDVKELRSLAKSVKFCPETEKENFLDKVAVDQTKVINQGIKDSGCLNEISNSDNVHKNVNEDSDNDLLPFEMSEGDNELVEGIHPPKYISQCIDGLLSNDDPKRHVASLRVVTSVIKKDIDNLEHLCVQLITILLHLQDRFSLEDYNELRFSAMVELTIKCPILVADHLTKEFYAQNYSLRQRVDILDVLTTAAARLSKPEANKENSLSSVDISGTNNTRNWRTVVQERIDKKTRRFSKKSEVESLQPTMNRFSKVAGHFFFPLLRGYDNCQNTFDLLGVDCMVLGSLVCSLGNIMYCARGTLIAQNMARSLLDFVWVLRYHNDAYVRQGLVFSLAMVVVSVPGFFLMTEVQNELAECQSWLEHVLHNDPSAQCRELALQVLVTIKDVFQKQFQPE